MSKSTPLTNPEVSGWNTRTQNLESSPSAHCSPVDALTIPLPSSGASSPDSSRSSSLAGEPIDSASAYYRAPRLSSTSRNSRRDPNKIPRPRNAFIIFRCQYCQHHAAENKGTDRSPTPEKTLSKRAGAIWRDMDEGARRPYQEQAERERIAHAIAHPGYKYRPNRKGIPRRRASGSVSRREQVEMLIKASAERGHRRDSGSDCDSPVSLNSSSPEPSDRSQTPSPGEWHALIHRRSMSLPHLHEPYPFAHTYFLQPTSCVSSPGGGPQRTARRASSASHRPLSPGIPPPDLSFELDYGPGTESFVYHPGQSSSTLSLPEIMALPEVMSLHEAHENDLSPTHVAPTALSQESLPEYFSSQPTPLYHRRQRSNTAPSTISPLTLVSSSLQNWNGEVTATAAARADAQLPTFAFTEDASSALTPTAATMLKPSPPRREEFPGSEPYIPGTPRSLQLVASMDIDLERTPRRADFPLNVQDQYLSQFATTVMSMEPDYPSSQQADPTLSLSSYELDSYMAGLDALSIAPAPYDMSPFQNVDFDDFIYIGHD